MELSQYLPQEEETSYEEWLKIYPEFPLYQNPTQKNNRFYILTDDPEVLSYFAAILKPDIYCGKTFLNIKGKNVTARCFWWD